MASAQPTQPWRPTQQPDAGTTGREASLALQQRSTKGTGWGVFGGIVVMIMGLFHVIEGLTALFHTSYFAVGQTGLVVEVSYTAWGWLHLILGAIIFAAGVAVMTRGRTWARVLGIVVAGLSAIVNIGFLAAFPLWSLILIALDVVVIYALSVHGGDARTYAS